MSFQHFGDHGVRLQRATVNMFIHSPSIPIEFDKLRRYTMKRLRFFLVAAGVLLAGGVNTAKAQTVTTTLAVGGGPQAVAVNPVTNKIYVANYLSSSVTVIDGETNATTTVGVGTNPNAVAVNPVTNKIYVPNTGSS